MKINPLKIITFEKMRRQIIVREKEGRIEIEIEAIFIGDDVCFIISGGKKHIGSISLYENNNKIGQLINGKHKDNIAAEILEEIIAKNSNINFSVISGIHFNKISTNEIKTALKMVESCTKKLCVKINKRKSINKLKKTL